MKDSLDVENNLQEELNTDEIIKKIDAALENIDEEERVSEDLFKAIREGDTEHVKEIISNVPRSISFAYGKEDSKDFGQSPLQVAIKTNRIEIANYLLDNGADVNFIERYDSVKWKAPVIHDAIRCAMANVRWNVVRGDKVEVEHTKEQSDEAFELLKRLVETGADVNKEDSYGNSPLNRAILDAKQILPYYDAEKDTLGTDRELNDDFKSDIDRIFKLLIDSGADLEFVNHNSGKSIRDEIKNTAIVKCLSFEI